MKRYLLIIILTMFTLTSTIYLNINKEEKNLYTFSETRQTPSQEQEYIDYIVTFLNEYRKIQIQHPLTLDHSINNLQEINEGVSARESYLKSFDYNKDLIPNEYKSFQDDMELAIATKIEGIELVREGISEVSDTKIKKGLRLMYFANAKITTTEAAIKIKSIEI